MLRAWRTTFLLAWCLSRGLSQQLCPSVEPSWRPCWAKELGWQFHLIWIPNQWDILAMEPILQPLPVNRADSQSFPTLQHSLRSHLPAGNMAEMYGRHGAHPIACLGRKPSQKPCPTVEQSFWPHLTRKSEKPQSPAYGTAQLQSPACTLPNG